MSQATNLASRCPTCGHLPTMNQCVIMTRQPSGKDFGRCICEDIWHKENQQ